MNLINSGVAAFYEDNTSEDFDWLVKSYTNIGEIVAIGSVITISINEILVPRARSVDYSVAISIIGKGDYPQNAATVVPFDEMDRLILGIDKLLSAFITTDRFRFTEISLKLDHLMITIFNNEKEKILLSVSIDNVTAYIGEMFRLKELRSLLVIAKSKIESVRIG